MNESYHFQYSFFLNIEIVITSAKKKLISEVDIWTVGGINLNLKKCYDITVKKNPSTILRLPWQIIKREEIKKILIRVTSEGALLTLSTGHSDQLICKLSGWE